MQKRRFDFTNSSVDYYFDGKVTQLKNITDQKNSILLVDENVYDHHSSKFRNWKFIKVRSGERYKNQSTVTEIITQIIEMEADRKTFLVGIGGGVVTDLTGFVASIYMRGIPFGFLPTSLLAMADASIGGKNGIDIGVYKNIAGIIRQPKFILFDPQFLSSLPQNEWENGFAEIIKHACIKDAVLFKELEANSLSIFQKKKNLVSSLIKRNALIKTKVVQQDEFETGDRKLLNFGHTLGHALENQYELSHGQAISIGMAFACGLSEQLSHFRDKKRVTQLLEKYGLPVSIKFDKRKVIDVLKMDKKKERDQIAFILLQKIGKAVIQTISIDQIYQSFE
jgi:3-dehydroquinate synthase